MLSRRKAILFTLLALIAGSIAFYLNHKQGSGSEAARVRSPAATAVVEPVNTPSTPVGKRPAIRVRKLANAQAREKLLAAIRRAHEVRNAALSRQAGRQSSGGSESAGGAATNTVSPEEKAYIAGAVEAMRPLLIECYDQLLERTDASGTVVVQFTIEGDPDVGGVIGSSETMEEGTTMQDTDFLECVRETMYGIEIDPPKSGGIVLSIFPFEFRRSDTP